MTSFLPIEGKLRKSGLNLIAGIDEAGRGPLAGPVVSAAVILKKGARLPGLTDSKKLSAKNRERLFGLILKNCVDYSIAIVSHKTIDKINILNAVRNANLMCIEALSTKPDFILIDGRDKQFITQPFQTIIKGDLRVRCIAAASILAKVTRDRLMAHYAKEFKEYNFQQHMGYGTRQHQQLIKKHGPCEIHRKSYNLVK